MNANFRTPEPYNEPILGYAPGSPERAELKAKLKELSKLKPDIPMVIGGKDIRTGKFGDCRPPHDHKKLVGRYHSGTVQHARDAVKAALKARKDWAATPFQQQIHRRRA